MCRERNGLIVPVLILGLLIAGAALGSVIDRRIDNGDDDAEQLAGGAFRDSTSTDLELPYEDVNQVDPQVVAVRFRDIGIPPGAPIVSAYVQFQVDETKGGIEHVNLIIDGELRANAVDFAAMPEIETRPRTLTEVSWAVPNWTNNNEQGPDQRTPDLSAIIQEIVSQSGWIRGNSIVLIFSDDPTNPSQGVRCAESYDGSTSGAPLLHIEYLAGSASQPQPADGQTVAHASVELSWSPGDYAAASRVYFGDDLASVEAGAGGTDKGLVYWTGYPVSGLDAGKTYYWRIDEVNEAHPDSPWKGEIWTFTTMPANATSPDPPDGSTNVRADVILSWDAGMNMVFQNIFIGTDHATVLNSTTPTFYTGDTSWQPIGSIENGETYYWRIDTHDTCGAGHKGVIWSFSTMPAIPVEDPNLIGWWTFEEKSGSSALDWSGHDNMGVFVGDPQRVAGYDGNALDLDGDDFMRIDDVADDVTGSEVTLSAWVKTTTTDSDWYSCNEATGSGNVLIFALVGGQPAVLDANNAYEGLPTTTVNDGQWHMLTYVSDGATGYIYVDAVLRNTHEAQINFSTDNRWSLGQEWDSANPTEFLTGLIDDVRLYNKALTELEIQKVMQVDPDLAWNPRPQRGIQMTIDEFSGLAWSSGDRATRHDVYFGTDADAVALADIATPMGVYKDRHSANSFHPGELEPGQTYYWRIDELNSDLSISRGRMWSFSTADYLVVDDMETYNLNPTGPEDANWIFYVWVDGLGDYDCSGTSGNGTGANVSGESAGVGGSIAMRFDYDNDGMVENPCTGSDAPRAHFYSRVEAQAANLPSGIGSDWTVGGVKALAMSFHGQAGNATTESLWVQLQDTSGYGNKVFYGYFPGESLQDFNEASRHEWNIDLANLGVDLTNVVSVVIGIGDESSAVPGGSGTLYFDDIRLYIPRFMSERLTQRPTDYVFDGIVDYYDLIVMMEDWLMTDYTEAPLVARYNLDGNANDSSGNGFNGNLVNSPTFAIGVGGAGMAVDCNGGDQFVNTGANAAELGIDGRSARTVTSWVFVRSFNSAAVYEMGNNNDGREFTMRVRSSIGQWRAQYGGTVHHTITDLDTRDSWVHLAQVYTGGYSHVYVNGVLKSSMAVRLDTGTGKDFRIGRWNNNYFDGLIDDIRIYNKALSEVEIVSVMAGGTVVNSYHPVESSMNLVDPEPAGSRAVNFADFAVFMDQWFEKQVWP